MRVLCKITGKCKIDYSMISFMKTPYRGPSIYAGHLVSFWSQVAYSLVGEPDKESS